MKFPRLAAALAYVISSMPILADWKDDVGFTRLQVIAAGDLPTTHGNGFTQVEALEAGANYMPDTASAMFTGKTFVNKTNTSALTSNHANTVASFFYSTASLLPGTAATTVDVYSADDWLDTGFLRAGTNSAPSIESRAVQNHSWIATSGDTAAFEEICQRLDFAIDRDGFVCVAGENNGSSTSLPLLMGQSYHTIVVGRTDGLHSAGFTTLDGAGRIKPDIVAPGSATSYTTPVVGGAAGILHEKLRTSPHSLSGADLPRTIKALLMASARKDRVVNWDNTTSRPLDEVYGAGEMNIHHAYMVMQAGRVSAGTTQHGQRAWAAESVSSSATQSYFFTIPAGAPSIPFCSALVWHRVISDNAPGAPWGNLSSSMANLDLSLYSATGANRGSLITQSASTLDNVEMIYQPQLAPGDYELVVSSDSAIATSYALAWHSLPVVTLSATTAQAREIDGQDGVFTFTRSGDTSYPLQVPITISGDAVAGMHYQTLAASLTIPAGQASAILAVDPIADATAQGDRAVTLTIASDFAIVSDSSSSATVTIKDKPADEWRFNAFTPGELSDPQVSGDSADPDRDSIANLLEYALGLLPKTPNPSVVAPGENGGYLSLALTKNPNASDLSWAAEVTSDLTDWTPATILTNTATHFEARDTVAKSSAERRMIRLKVTRP
ncbi:MAG TPA: hypothetical protein VFY13_00315 [Luteolibacter sp.]|nr:hypothetical protein [Luteolibacter sp.]